MWVIQLPLKPQSHFQIQTTADGPIICRKKFGICNCLNVGRQTLIEDLTSTGGRLNFRGKFDKSVDGRPNVYGLRKTSTVYRSISGGQANGAMLQTFFVNKLKEGPRGYKWIFNNCLIIYLIDQSYKSIFGSTFDEWATIHRLITIQTAEDIDVVVRN